MRQNRPIATLCNYGDWLAKAEYDLSEFHDTSSVYALANCLLSLNALPEWIVNDQTARPKLKAIARTKLRIMTNDDPSFTFDPNKLGQVDHQLRFIRMFCNHAKHSKPKKIVDRIRMCAPYPVKYPKRFDHLSLAGAIISGEDLARGVILFWRGLIPTTDEQIAEVQRRTVNPNRRPFSIAEARKRSRPFDA